MKKNFKPFVMVIVMMFMVEGARAEKTDPRSFTELHCALHVSPTADGVGLFKSYQIPVELTPQQPIFQLEQNLPDGSTLEVRAATGAMAGSEGGLRIVARNGGLSASTMVGYDGKSSLEKSNFVESAKVNVYILCKH